MVKDILTKKEKVTLRLVAENAVYIQEGDSVGRWTRADRIALVYSVLCSMIRLSKERTKKAKQKK